MATDFERFRDDAQANGFNPAMVADTGSNEHAQRAYIGFKLFQIEEHIRRIADDTMATEEGPPQRRAM